MLKTLAVANYRSINKLVIPLGRLNLITGPNGSGKSNLYRALRLLAETAQGGVVNALAREGGLDSTFWAGPENITRRMRNGEVPIEATVATAPNACGWGLRVRISAIRSALGLPESNGISCSRHVLPSDPEIKKECIWSRPVLSPGQPAGGSRRPDDPRPSSRSWEVLAQHTPNFDSLFDQVGSLRTSPEVMQMREFIRRWRFYDHFRSDADAPVRQPQLGTRTPVLHHDGRDLAAALADHRRNRRSRRFADGNQRRLPRCTIEHRDRCRADVLRSSFIRKDCCGHCLRPSCRTEHCGICCWWRRC